MSTRPPILADDTTLAAGRRVGRCAPADRIETMDTPHGDVVIRIGSTLRKAAEDRADGSDLWSVRIERLDERGEKVLAATAVSYQTGLGLRRTLAGTDTDIPVQPRAQDVLVSLGSDVDAALGLPEGDDAAASWMMGEYGYDDIKTVRPVVRMLRANLKKVSAPLGDASLLRDFAEWGQSLEHRPEPSVDGPDHLRIVLPTVEAADGTHSNGWIDVEFRTSDKVSMTTTGARVEGAITLSMVGNVVTREDSTARWNGRSAGQVADLVRETWADHAEVVELCDLWDAHANNDLNAGTRAQQEALDKVGMGAASSFKEDLDFLRAHGLEPDPSVRGLDGKPYRYGSAWMIEELPQELPQRIRELAAAIPGSRPTSDAAPRI